MNKTLFTYFSATGTTRRVAEKLAQEKRTDILEIKPVIPYTNEDINWQDHESRANREGRDQVEVAMEPLDIRDYDDIYVGFPIWWYTAPRIIFSFFKTHDFSNKTVHLFATSGGSSIQRAQQDLSKAFPQVKIVDAKRY